MPSYATLSALAFCVASVTDLLLSGDEAGVFTVACAVGIGVATGGLFGLGVHAVFRLFRRLPMWAKAFLWAAAGGAVAASLIASLNVVGLLDGPERSLALTALGASVGAGVGLFSIALALQPGRRYPRGWLAGIRWRFRAPVVVLLASLSAGCVWADRELLVGSYPSAHAALRAGGLIAAYAVLVAILHAVPKLPERPRWVARLTLIALALFPFVFLRPTHYRELAALLSAPYPKLCMELLRRLGDPDFDGYSAVLGGGDCNSLASAVHPAAAEIPENGVDDNCQLGDAEKPPPLPPPDSVRLPETPAPVSVVLITIDTLRADHMGAYGYRRDTTPNIDQWGEKNAVRFEKAYTSGGWTSLALSSLFRGVYPRRLKWTRLYETNKWRLVRGPLEDALRPGERSKKIYGMPLEEPRKPLAWWLSRRGMKTIAVVDDGFSEFLSPEMGLADGFEVYIQADELPRRLRNDRGVTARAVSELNRVEDDVPFFLWAHYFGPHNPSKRHRGTPDFGSGVRDKYDHEIAFVDRQVGVVLRLVERLADKRPIAVMLTSDHGEIIHRTWRNHGIDLSEDSIHVPLFFSAPGLEPGVSEHLVSLVDIMPTILDLTGTPEPHPQDGVSLLDVLNRPAQKSSPRAIVVEFWRYDKRGRITAEQVAALDGSYKLERDVRSEAKKLWRQWDRYRKRKPNVLGEVDVPHLESTLAELLEQSSQVDVSE